MNMQVNFHSSNPGTPRATWVQKMFRPVRSLHVSSSRGQLMAGHVSAGLPSPTEEYSEGQLDLNEHLLKNPDSTFFVRVSGDSMIDVGIHPGDLLVVDRSLRPANGKIVIAVIDGDLTVKKLFKENGKLYLMPENTRYASIEITEEMRFMIWGVVTYVIHAL